MRVPRFVLIPAVLALLIGQVIAADTRPEGIEPPELRETSNAKYALIIYITAEDRIEVGSATVEEEEITKMLEARKGRYEEPKILIRAHKDATGHLDATVRAVKRATKAAAAAGVSRVVFSSWK